MIVGRRCPAHMGAIPVRVFLASQIQETEWWQLYEDTGDMVPLLVSYHLEPATQCPRCFEILEVGPCERS